MGVPALFRWLAAKYPKIIEPVVEVKESLVDGEFVSAVNLLDPNPNNVEFDNLYLDMNGIIHPCCHPENQAAPPTEQDMMVEIFKYIDRIFGMIRPRKLLYLAIDGVAPRAKMNQQRSRRFRAAMEAELKAAKEAEIREEVGAMAVEDDENENAEALGEPFDSNCITPGTPFMALVAESLKFYVLDRLNNHPAWKGVKVILSDASVPGEGEHKIMDFIRRQRLDPSFDPNTRHVIYGLDADLIMLSMATHEPHFKVLREDVFAEEANKKYSTCKKCGQTGHWGDECPGITPSESGDNIQGSSGAAGGNSSSSKPTATEYKLIEKPFIFLDVPTLREYLEAEMKPAADPGFKFEPERAIDDWIFLCFFVGNDFLPHLPCLEIREGAIDILIDIYKQNAHKLGGYICRDGIVNLERVEIIMKGLGEKEELIFKKRREKEERRLENASKRRRTANSGGEFENAAAASLSSSESRRVQIDSQQIDHPNQSVSTQPQTTQLNVPIHNVHDETGLLTENAELVRQRILLREQNKIAAQALKESLLNKEPLPIETQVTKRNALEARLDDPEAPEDNVRLWEPGFRNRFYSTKFHIDPLGDQEFIRKLIISYVEGLCWVMGYYYQGCPSWKWFYPYHYAPFAADLTDFKDYKVNFNLGQPFRPFDQLMGVFPAASSSHIPEQFRHLMTEASSEVIDFYPESFAIDLNGKKKSWQGVALLPFIDEDRLLKALEKLYPLLTPEQRKLNARGDAKLFVHSSRPPILPIDVTLDIDVVLSLDPLECNGLGGYAKLDNTICDIGHTYLSPLTRLENKLRPIESSMVRVFNFFNPYHERPNIRFRSKILPGCRLPEKRLTEEDRSLVYSGAASRSFQGRLILSGSSFRPQPHQQYHSMHQEYSHKLQAQDDQYRDRHYGSGYQGPITRPRSYHPSQQSYYPHQKYHHLNAAVPDSHDRTRENYNSHYYGQGHPDTIKSSSDRGFERGGGEGNVAVDVHYSPNSFAALAPKFPFQNQSNAGDTGMYPPPPPPPPNQPDSDGFQQPAHAGFHRPQPPNPWADKRSSSVGRDLDSLYGRHVQNRRL